MENAEFPKTLIICGEPLNNATATGITITNLFKGWPRDRIAQIYTADIQPDESVCQNQFRLSNEDLLVIGHLQKFTNGRKKRTETISIRKESPISDSNKASKIRYLLSQGADLIPYKISKELVAWLDKFQPEVIYSTLANIRLSSLAQRISYKYDAPIVPHFMDDWITTYSSSGKSITTIINRKILVSKVVRIINSAPSAIVIGQAMADEYFERYKKRFTPFMNPVQPMNNTKALSRTSKPNNLITLVYIGGLHLSRHENIIDIANAITELYDQGLNLEFKIYTPEKDHHFLAAIPPHPSVKLCGSADPSDVQNILEGCDVAIHVESFVDRYREYTRLSVSTKIPQYFAAGIPTLAYGPSELASCRYIQEHGCGLLVDTRQLASLRTAIGSLVQDKALRETLGINGLQTAHRFHDADKERERFRSLLSEAALKARASE